MSKQMASWRRRLARLMARLRRALAGECPVCGSRALVLLHVHAGE
jgi:hypothetical protein